MTTVSISGWSSGFQKVKFTFLLQEALGYSLSQAKRVTDLILDDSDVELQVEADQMEHLLSSMKASGSVTQ